MSTTTPTKLIVIDADRHIMEPLSLWDDYLAPRFRDRIVANEDSWPFVASVDGQRVVDAEPAKTPFRADKEYAERFKDAIAADFDAESNLRAMDDEGVTVAVHFPGTAGLHVTWRDGTDPAIAVAIAQAYNSWLYDFLAKDPVRLKGIALLPVQDMQETVTELHRVVNELGFVGAFVRPNPMDGRTLADPYYDPMYAAASELNIPIMVHEAAATTLNQIGRGRISGFGRHIACHPMEQALACLNFCGDGILERFPDLTVAFMESGCGWLPFWLERMDEHFKHSTFGAGSVISKRPSEYFSTQCFISSEGEEAMIPVVADLVGDHVIVTASDYPHPDELCMTDIHTREDISDSLRRKIFFDNPMRLYSLDSAEVEAAAI